MPHETEVILERDARLIYVILIKGGKTIEEDITVRLKGEGSEAKVFGIVNGSGNDSHRFHIRMIHEGSRTNALVWINAVGRERSEMDFHGFVEIPSNVRLVNSYLAFHALTIGEWAKATAVPALEIESDEVQCSHEVTVGRVEEEQLFYLMSRGIVREEAEELIADGFLDMVVEKIPSSELRKKICHTFAQ